MSTQSSITLDTLVAQVEETITSDIGGEIVMMSLENSAYYGLDSIGSRIWQLIAQPVAVARLCEQLQAEYEVDRDTCHQHVLELLNELHKHNLVQTVKEESA